MSLCIWLCVGFILHAADCGWKAAKLTVEVVVYFLVETLASNWLTNPVVSKHAVALLSERHPTSGSADSQK